MNWTRIQKIAILKSIKYFADADDSVHKDEMEYLGVFLEEQKLPNSAINEATLMEQHEMYNIINQFDNEQKDILKSYWIEAMYADGMVSMEDLNIIAMQSANFGIKVSSSDIYSF